MGGRGFACQCPNSDEKRGSLFPNARLRWRRESARAGCAATPRKDEKDLGFTKILPPCVSCHSETPNPHLRLHGLSALAAGIRLALKQSGSRRRRCSPEERPTNYGQTARTHSSPFHEPHHCRTNILFQLRSRTYWTPVYDARRFWSALLSWRATPRFPQPHRSYCLRTPRSGSSCSYSPRFVRAISAGTSQDHCGRLVFSGTPIRVSGFRRRRRAYAVVVPVVVVRACCAGIHHRRHCRSRRLHWWIPPPHRRSCHRRRRSPFLRWSVPHALIFYDGSYDCRRRLCGRRRRSRSAARRGPCHARCAGCCCWRRRSAGPSKARSRRREPPNRGLRGRPSTAETRKR